MIKDNLEILKQILENEPDTLKIKHLRELFGISGHSLNSNDKVILGISKGLLRCQGECPCDQGDIPIEDKLCPCKKFREDNVCKCNLYVK